MSAVPATLNDVMNVLKPLAAQANNLQQQVNAKNNIRNTGALPGAATYAPPGGWSPVAPNVRKGENTMSSRGFSFSRLIPVLSGSRWAKPEQCQTEIDICQRLSQKMMSQGWAPLDNKSLLVPIIPEFFPEDVVETSFYYEMKGLLEGGVMGVDQDSMAWAAQRGLQTKSVGDGLNYKAGGAAISGTPAMSWIDQSVGGSFVPPPTFGPPIELLRNVETLLSAGATIVPLGPSGRLIMPRLTAATQGSWSGENTATQPTTPSTGQLELSAKKIIGVIVLPNELLRFGAPATEALIRADLFKTVALIMDQGLLEGPGSSNVPLGLSTAAQIANNPFGFGQVTVSGNQLSAQQIYDFFTSIWANNGKPRGWIMRPEMLGAFLKARWTPYSGGTNLGGFLFEFQRTLKGELEFYLGGLPVTISANITNSYGGNAGQTYIFCGDWPDYYLGMFGAIEFAQTSEGYNLFASDQTAVRAILSCDGAPRHPGVFSFGGGIQYAALAG